MDPRGSGYEAYCGESGELSIGLVIWLGSATVTAIAAAVAVRRRSYRPLVAAASTMLVTAVVLPFVWWQA